jgi:uncharacterized membrane protein HdeD (DUF308 family)
MSTPPSVTASLRGMWVWFLVLGLALIVIGTVALSYLFLTTVYAVFFFGILLVAGGFVQLVSGILSRQWGWFFFSLLIAVLDLVVGLFMIEEPVRAALAWTLFLAVVFLVGGLFRIIVALVERFTNWGWVLFDGVVTFALGVLLWRRWPEDSLWTIGLFVGIGLIFRGWTWVMLALAVRTALPAPPPSP